MTATRSIGLAFALVFAGCAERQTGIDDDEAEAEPTCMILPARGYWDDGSTKTIKNEWDTVGSVCLCLTEEERMSESVREELNDLAEAECDRISALHWDFDWTECEDLYEARTWWNYVFVASDEHAWMNRTGLTCDGSEPTSCSVREHEPEIPFALLALIGLLGLRLRSSANPDLAA
jgi:hypothetical protein